MIFCITAKTTGMSTESNCVPYNFPNINWPLISSRANFINPMSRSSEVRKKHFRQSTQMLEKKFFLSFLWPFIKFPTFPPYATTNIIHTWNNCFWPRDWSVFAEQLWSRNKKEQKKISPTHHPSVLAPPVIRMSLSPGSSYSFPAIFYFFHPSPAMEYPFLSLDLLPKNKFYFISRYAQWFSIIKHSANVCN